MCLFASTERIYTHDYPVSVNPTIILFLTKKFFLQQCGPSMETHFSPSLANIYMSCWETQFLFSNQNPFATHIRWFGRYIDDLHLVWSGTDLVAEQFANYIDNNNLNLKFTFKFQENFIHFLDITCVGDEKLGVSVAPFRKSTTGNATLLASSCHPPPPT